MKTIFILAQIEKTLATASWFRNRAQLRKEISALRRKFGGREIPGVERSPKASIPFARVADILQHALAPGIRREMCSEKEEVVGMLDDLWRVLHDMPIEGLHDLHPQPALRVTPRYARPVEPKLELNFDY